MKRFGKKPDDQVIEINIIPLLPLPPMKILIQRTVRLLRKRTSLMAVNDVQNYTLTSHSRKRTVSFHFITENVISIHQQYGFLKYLLKLLWCFITRPDGEI